MNAVLNLTPCKPDIASWPLQGMGYWWESVY